MLAGLIQPQARSLKWPQAISRQLIEIHQARQAELVRAVHDRVAREHRLESRRLAGIRADGLDADAEDIPLAREERNTLWMEARRMGPVGPDVEKCLGVAALGPVGADQHPGVGGDAAVLPLPILHDRLGEQKVRVLARLPSHIDDAGRPDEALHRDIVRGVVRIILAGDPVNRRVKMGARMLAAGEVVPVPGRTARIIARDLLQRERL